MITALEKCKEIGLPECHSMRERIFKRHLWLSEALASRYIRTTRKAGYVQANLELVRIEAQLRLGATGLFADSDAQTIKDYAAAKSKVLEKDAIEFNRRFNAEQAFQHIKQVVESTNIIPFPYSPKSTDSQKQTKQKKIAALKRVFDPRWWQRLIRVLAGRRMEAICRELGFVSRYRGAYVSDYTLQQRKMRKHTNALILQDLIAENEEGYSTTLAHIAESGQSNPENRRTELMVRMRGYEEVAQSMGYVGLFITLTAPSKYHAVNASGKANTKFEGATPKQVQDYLCQVWSRTRAAWAKRGIKPFGFRIAEPHHDGTPHWHLLLFISEEQKSLMLDIFEHYAVIEDKAELKGKHSTRFDVLEIDPTVGTAAGYIAKYVSKNIDGYQVDIDYEACETADRTHERVEAWASTWGIRQFQQIGTVSVTVWRELRRGVREQVFNEATDEDLLAIAQAADDGNWALFVELMGGALVKRNDQPIRPLQVLSDEENEYGELFERIRGIILKGAFHYITRVHTWIISKRKVNESEKSDPADDVGF